MITDSGIQANRRNAELSTGPTSAAGKAISAMNSLKHGLYSAAVVLPNEDPAEYQKLHDEYQDFYQPRNVVEQHRVDHLTAAEWRLRRIDRVEAQLVSDPEIEDIDRRSASIDRMSRCHTRVLRQWDKLCHDLEPLRLLRERESQPESAPAAETGSQSAPELPKKVEAEDDDDKWATPEEYEAQLKMNPPPRKFKPPKKVQLNSHLGPNGEEVVVARIWKGQSVDKFPDEE